jgi:hypothetical protein
MRRQEGSSLNIKRQPGSDAPGLSNFKEPKDQPPAPPLKGLAYFLNALERANSPILKNDDLIDIFRE